MPDTLKGAIHVLRQLNKAESIERKTNPSEKQRESDKRIAQWGRAIQDEVKKSGFVKGQGQKGDYRKAVQKAAEHIKAQRDAQNPNPNPNTRPKKKKKSKAKFNIVPS